MTTWFVSRHQGAIAWARQQGIEAVFVDHLDPHQVRPGDTVVGTLPVPLVAEINAKGARYFHLSINLPQELRGRELSAEELRSLGAKLEEYSAARRSF